jgi:hypothetical protein
MKSARIYDFSMPAGGSFVLPVEGCYVRIMGSTGAVELVTETYRIGPIAAGQGQANTVFKRLVINDKSGAPNIGTLLIGGENFVDQRITGDVSVIDGGKNKSIAGLTFFVGMNQTPVVAQVSQCQLWNPVGSGKNVIVSSYGFTSDLAATIFVRTSTTPLPLLQGNPPSKKMGGALGISEARSLSAGSLGATVTTFYPSPNLTAGSTYNQPLKEPIVIPPGFGIFCYSSVANSTLFFNLELTEEPL